MEVDACSVKLSVQEDAGKGDRLAVDFGNHYVLARVVVAGGVVGVGDGFQCVEVVVEVVGDFAPGVDFEDGGVVFVAAKVAEGEAGYGRRVE